MTEGKLPLCKTVKRVLRLVLKKLRFGYEAFDKKWFSTASVDISVYRWMNTVKKHGKFWLIDEVVKK
ncbi:MAG: hypothetical protein ACPH3N_07445 [Alcanivorax sediminis]|uniref:hypothetical protein n=1 Tax=Alcanivorax sediminis TaxID=2663008 RepID=UPI003C37BADA